jgi:uroporphyrinogen decarboxylase
MEMLKMDSKERVIKAIEFKEPDRVPNGCYNLAIAPGSRADSLRQLYEKYPLDFAEVSGMGRYIEWNTNYKKGIYKDAWGVIHENLQNGIIGQPIQHPLAKWEHLHDYEFPDPLSDFLRFQKPIRNANQSKYLLFDGGSIWQLIHSLRGFENTLIDVVTRRKELVILIDKIIEYHLSRLGPFLDLAIDGVLFNDDWGTQKRLMVKLEQWKDFFKPAYNKLFKPIHRKGKHVFFHSDGNVLDLIPEWIDLGVDVANIQVNLIGINKTRQKTFQKICIAADVDRQHILPFGNTEEVRNVVKDIIQGFSSQGGGLILYGEIGPDVSLKNAESMLKALKDYGRLI